MKGAIEDAACLLEYLITWKNSTDIISAAEALEVGCLHDMEGGRSACAVSLCIPQANTITYPDFDASV